MQEHIGGRQDRFLPGATTALKAAAGKSTDAAAAAFKSVAELRGVIHEVRGLRNTKDSKYLLLYADEAVYRSKPSRLVDGDDGMLWMSWEERFTLPINETDEMLHVVLH